MKLSKNFFCLLLLVLVCVAALCLDSAEARRKNRGRIKGRNRLRPACKYSRKDATIGECNTATNLQEWSAPLKKGDPTTCAPTKIFKKRCKKRKNKRLKGCKYDRRSSSWSECDPTTGLKNRIMNLMTDRSGPDCPPTRTKTKKCGCRYDKGDWSECDLTTNLKTRFLTPRSGSSPDCKPKVKSKRCKSRRAALKEPKSSRCRYSFSEWSECDKRSNTMTQTMSLKNGDPNICQRSKTLSKKCKIACKFRKGQWSECDEKTQLITRVDTLVKGNLHECDENRQITKKCKKQCKFAFGDWGACDPNTKLRSRVKKLIRGDPKRCVEEEIVTRPCQKRDGKERCFFGPWGDFGPCTNGVRAKNRPVLQGGVECERKAVITMACQKIR